MCISTISLTIKKVLKMKKVISVCALVALFSVSMNAQQEDPKAKKANVAKNEAKTPAKKECAKDEKKGSCCAAKKEARV